MEMNISLSQNPDAIAEIKELMSTNETFISSKFTRPMLTLKEDMMTGWYKLTKGLVSVKKDLWMDTVIHLGIDFITKKIIHIRNVYKTSTLFQEVKQSILQTEEETLDPNVDIDTLVLDRLQYSGFGLFSILCPNDFEMVIPNGKSKDGKPVHITQGTMISGTFDKEALGSSSGSLIHHLAKDYGNRFASDFITNLQRFVCDVFQHIGFSVGMKDFIPSSREPINKSIENAFFKVISHMENQPDPYLRELKIRAELNKPSNEGLAFANQTLDPETNNLVAMVDCGSKGNWVNIASITSVIGQQFVGGQRIRKVCAGRTMSCFPRYSYRTDAPDELPLNYSYIDVVRILQSRGFVRNSYFNGLSPVEYFMICPGGRSGLIDTAITTAETGYIQRKIAKILEDLQISYTGTVVTPSQNVIQFAYGGDNLDASRLICYEKDQKFNPVNFSFIDIQHVTERLNKQVEVKRT